VCEIYINGFLLAPSTHPTRALARDKFPASRPIIASFVDYARVSENNAFLHLISFLMVGK
jgi:hypothetical protein